MLLKCRIGLGGWKAKLVVRFALTVTFNDKWQSLLFDIFIKSPKLFILVLNWIFKWCGWDFSFHLPSMTLSSSSLCLLFSFFFLFYTFPGKTFFVGHFLWLFRQCFIFLYAVATLLHKWNSSPKLFESCPMMIFHPRDPLYTSPSF